MHPSHAHAKQGVHGSEVAFFAGGRDANGIGTHPTRNVGPHAAGNAVLPPAATSSGRSTTMCMVQLSIPPSKGVDVDSNVTLQLVYTWAGFHFRFPGAGGPSVLRDEPPKARE